MCLKSVYSSNLTTAILLEYRSQVEPKEQWAPNSFDEKSFRGKGHKIGKTGQYRIYIIQ